MDMDIDSTPLQLSPAGEQEVTKLWRVWRTVNEMLVDRGYAISQEELTISRARFHQKYRDQAMGTVDRRVLRIKAAPTAEMLKIHTPRPSKRNPDPQPGCGDVWVEFCPETTTVGNKHFKEFAKFMHENHYTTGIFITLPPATATSLRVWESLPQQGMYPEHFREEELLVNITRHELVPRHVLLSDDEKYMLLQRYRLKETQLPRIQVGDPVSKYLGLRRGQVVKIIRKSETAGRYASYRWVF